jgi:hypothetical protein
LPEGGGMTGASFAVDETSSNVNALGLAVSFPAIFSV